MRKKPYRKKNNLSIESSKVNVWLVWILTTKRKSLKRMETYQKRVFHFLTVCYVNSFFRFNLSNGFTPWIYIHIHLIVSHWTLDCSFVFEWCRCCLRSERIPRLCLADYTRNPYSFCLLKCAIIPLGSYWPAVVLIISSCLVSNFYPVSYLRRLSRDYCCNW